jgi:hypothetical protein
VKKVKVKFLTSIASATFSYKTGDEALIDEKTATAWEESGVCAIVTEKK